MKRMLLFVVALVVAGCPPSEKKPPEKEKQDAPCARIGQTCEFSPGKLGTCVMKDGCTDATPACFTCQSQH